MSMTDDEKRAYALHLIKQHNLDGVEFVSIFEMYPEYVGAPEDEIADISDEDAAAVDRLISSAKITVEFPQETTNG